MFSTDFGLGTALDDVQDTWGTGRFKRDREMQDARAQSTWQMDQDVIQRARINSADILSRVDAAKAAGLHPLVGMGITPSPSGGQVAFPQSSSSGGNTRFDFGGEDKEMRDAQLRRANAEADIAETQAKSAAITLAGQAGQPPLVKQVPREITGAVGDGTSIAGVAPTQGQFLVRDLFGNPRSVSGFSPEFGQNVEQQGEISQFGYSLPHLIDYLRAMVLDTPAEGLERSFNRLSQKRPPKRQPSGDFYYNYYRR